MYRVQDAPVENKVWWPGYLFSGDTASESPLTYLWCFCFRFLDFSSTNMCIDTDTSAITSHWSSWCIVLDVIFLDQQSATYILD